MGTKIKARRTAEPITAETAERIDRIMRNLPGIHRDDPDGIREWIESTYATLGSELVRAWDKGDVYLLKEIMTDIERGLGEIRECLKKQWWRNLNR